MQNRIELAQNDPPEFDYQRECQRTKSDKFYGELVPLNAFQVALMDAVAALQALDAIKKTLFYGKPLDGQRHTFTPNAHSMRDRLASQLDSDSPCPDTAKANDVIHGVIGKATEAGEGLENLLNMFNGYPFDVVNAREEIFDGQWYDAIQCEALGLTFEQGQRQNIAKLRARFPDKFTEQNALTRDLDAERRTLEELDTRHDFGLDDL